MIQINRFSDFLVESETNQDILTEKDLQNISDLFLEIADDFGLKEIENSLPYKFDNSFLTVLDKNKKVIWFIINIEYDLYSKINKIIDREFIPLLRKWGYYMYRHDIDHVTSPISQKKIKKLYYFFRKARYDE
jgi:hypothetical protein